MSKTSACVVALAVLLGGCGSSAEEEIGGDLVSGLDPDGETTTTAILDGATTSVTIDANGEIIDVEIPNDEDWSSTGTEIASNPTTTTEAAAEARDTGEAQRTGNTQRTGGTPRTGTTPTTATISANGQRPTAAVTTTRPVRLSTTDTVPAATPSANLEWGTDASSPVASWTKPALNRQYDDPVYGTEVRRVTSADGTRFNRNTYSRRQAENADGSLFMTYHGSSRYHVYSVEGAALVRALDIHPDAEPQWHPTDPGRIRHLAGPNSSSGALQLLETTVSTGRTTVIADFTDRVKARIPGAAYVKDRAEGSPSIDGNRWAWIVYDAQENIRGVMSYDLATDTILGVTTDLLSDNLDWVSVSPTGRYVVAGFWEGTIVYDADMSNRRVLTDAAEHSDIALDRNGRDTYVYIDFHGPSPTAGWLTAIDMATLERTKIFDLYDNANTSLHISGKGYDKPGWVVVSSYNCKVPGAWSCEKVMAVEIANDGRILNLAHTYNCGDGYWTETHAVVNRSFDAVYFNSDAGSCGIDAEVYRIELPSFR